MCCPAESAASLAAWNARPSAAAAFISFTAKTDSAASNDIAASDLVGTAAMSGTGTVTGLETATDTLTPEIPSGASKPAPQGNCAGGKLLGHFRVYQMTILIAVFLIQFKGSRDNNFRAQFRVVIRIL